MSMLAGTPYDVAQVVNSTASHLESSAFNAKTKIIRVVCTVDTYVDIGSAPVATSASLYMVAGVPEFFGVSPAWKLSALRVGGSDGKVSIAEGFRSIL